MQCFKKLMLAAFFIAVLASQAFCADFDLAQKSTLETILKRGELLGA
jgi:polar amino acid transport system substrate-binding protein